MEAALKNESSLGKQANSKGFFPKKSAKRISLAHTSLIPKRFSLNHQAHSPVKVDNTLGPSATLSSQSSGKKFIPKSPSPKDSKNPANPSPSISPLPLSPNTSAANNASALMPSSPTSLYQAAPYRQALDRNTSFSSSTPSEKSTIGKSLNAFKRTTKSILFLESNSNGSASQSSGANNYSYNYNYSFNVVDSPLLNRVNSEEMSVIRRSISYTEAERKQAIFYADNSREITRRNIAYEPAVKICSYDNSDPNCKCGDTSDSDSDSNSDSDSDDDSDSIEGNDSDDIEPCTIGKHGNKSMSKEKRHARKTLAQNRQRSKTIDNSENPLMGLANNTNTGLLSSITNFVKINRNSVSTSSSAIKLNKISQELPKLDHLELVEAETPAELLSRLLSSYPLTFICEVLSSEDNEILKQTLQHYLKSYYDFSNEPLDIALRTFLMLNHLPKETQQIDRFIYQFAKYYHGQHPELGFDQDTVYILTYSLIMVHTDKFNPNNKRKMTRFEFVQNVLSALENNFSSFSNTNELTNLILKELLGYFFDNITYCPLIKISQEQSVFALEALKSKSFPFPYPNITFLNSSSTGRNSDNDYRKPSVSSSLSIPSSTTSTHRSSSQQVLQAQQPIRKKSSSFLWSSTSIMDPYDYIVKNDTETFNELKFLASEKDLNLTCRNPFILPSTTEVDNSLDEEFPTNDMIGKQLNEYGSLMDEEIDPEFLYHIWKSLTDSRIGFTLKVPKEKGSFLMSNKTEAIPLNEADGKEFCLTRVIKVGLLDRQENSTSQKDTTPTTVLSQELAELSINGDNNNLHAASKTQLVNKYKNSVWKRYFCILTVVGMFFFKDVSSFRMKFCGRSETDGTKMVIIEESSRNKPQFETSSTLANGPSNTVTSNGSNSDSGGFISFSHFRSEKSDKFEKIEKEKSESILPSFVISNNSFAIRKLENIEYDEIINDLDTSTVVSPPQNTSECSASNTVSSFSSNAAAISPKPSTTQLPALRNSQSSVPEEYVQQTPENVTDPVLDKQPKKKSIAKPETWKYTFFIYSRMSRNIFMVSSLTELKSWIHSINIMSVLNGVKVDHKPLNYHIIPREYSEKANESAEEPQYYEVIPQYSISIEQRFTHRASDDLLSTDERDESSESFDSGKNNRQGNIKGERRRNRSSTTFLSKLAPSMPILGLGLSNGSSKNDSEKKTKLPDVDEFSNNVSSDSDSNQDYATASLKPSSLCENHENESYVEESATRITNESEVAEKHEAKEDEFDIGEDTSDLSTPKASSKSSSTSSKNVHQYLLDHLYSVKRLALTMPLQKKTREDMLSTAKILRVKLEWLWYEKCRSQTISVISKRIMALNENYDDRMVIKS
ncbi:hypothetical protein PMKS-002172 [Pichia membranifaciens]|uniref:SEC7 domain-containing protein n=1 Tax=Pichia membranifaciens TaxID=4926 RepID=A0A1Q2YGQ0_9ASCO|nr:hypothetical protein PMKS-002172 [Pichia membranifaciens]